MASSEENDLEILLAKATNPLHQQPDLEVVAAFCNLVDQLHDGPQTALRLLSHKIQSPIEKESLMALTVLEESVKKCGAKYRSEVGKFRFLNEMIKVVSPKYLGNRASVKVKQKIVELMYIWSMELKQESKIFEAYQMLKRQGVVIEDPVYVLDHYIPPLPPLPPRPKNAFFEDEEKAQQLQKLLRSRNADDLQAANRLIKTMVREADRKMELMAKRSTELETVHNNASVLSDMLKHYNSHETSEEEKDLMKELYESCERLRPKLFRLAAELDDKDDGLDDMLKASDELARVISTYKKAMGIADENGSSGISVNSKVETSLLDLGSPVSEATPKPADSLLDDQLLVLGLSDGLSSTNQGQNNVSSSNAIETTSLSDLDRIFAASNVSSTQSSFDSSFPNSVINNFSNSVFAGDGDVALLKPQQTAGNIGTPSSQNVSVNASPAASRGLEELDELGKLLLKQSLPSTPSIKLDFPSPSTKVPLSQLKQRQEQRELAKPQLISSSALTETVFEDLRISDSGSERVSPTRSPVCDSLSLKDIFVPLDTIQPGSLSPLNIHEKNGLNVVIHFAKDTPRPDITVMVISSMSKNSSPVKNVSFQAAVPKSMKLKLQPPSATDLPPHNPILPPAAITQVLLLSNPQKETIRLKYKLNYTMNDENFTDVGDIPNLFAAR